MTKIVFGESPRVGRFAVSKEEKVAFISIFDGINCNIGDEVTKENRGEPLGEIIFTHIDDFDWFLERVDIKTNIMIKTPQTETCITLVFKDNKESVEQFKEWIKQSKEMFIEKLFPVTQIVDSDISSVIGTITEKESGN